MKGREGGEFTADGGIRKPLGLEESRVLVEARLVDKVFRFQIDFLPNL